MRLLYLFTLALLLTVSPSPAEGKRGRSKAHQSPTKVAKPRAGKSAAVKQENRLSKRLTSPTTRTKPAAKPPATSPQTQTKSATKPNAALQRVKGALPRLRRNKTRRAKHNESGELLFENSAALQTRLEMIGSAKSEILMSTYIFTDDVSGNKVAQALGAAARSGVRVHLIVDGQGTKLSKEMESTLRRDGVEIGVHNKLSLKSFFNLAKAQRRMHDKLLVIDGQTLLVGGRNIGDPYFATSGDFVKTDLEVVVAGRSAESARIYFKKLWDGPLVQGSNKTISLFSSILRPFRRENRGQARFASDAPHTTTKIKSENTTTSQVQQLIASAQSEVVIRTPYLIPTKGVMRALQSALKRGVKVRVFTNSFATRDTVLSQLGYEASFQQLARMGVEIHEFKATASHREARHEKAIVVDARHVLVGSHNIDPRSEHHNKETGVVFSDRSMAKKLLAQNNQVREASSLVAKNGKVLLSGKSRGCGPGCRALVAVAGPILKLTGLMSLL